METLSPFQRMFKRHRHQLMITVEQDNNSAADKHIADDDERPISKRRRVTLADVIAETIGPEVSSSANVASSPEVSSNADVASTPEVTSSTVDQDTDYDSIQIHDIKLVQTVKCNPNTEEDQSNIEKEFLFINPNFSNKNKDAATDKDSDTESGLSFDGISELFSDDSCDSFRTYNRPSNQSSKCVTNTEESSCDSISMSDYRGISNNIDYFGLDSNSSNIYSSMTDDFTANSNTDFLFDFSSFLDSPCKPDDDANFLELLCLGDGANETWTKNLSDPFLPISSTNTDRDNHNIDMAELLCGSNEDDQKPSDILESNQLFDMNPHQTSDNSDPNQMSENSDPVQTTDNSSNNSDLNNHTSENLDLNQTSHNLLDHRQTSGNSDHIHIDSNSSTDTLVADDETNDTDDVFYPSETPCSANNSNSPEFHRNFTDRNVTIGAGDSSTARTTALNDQSCSTKKMKSNEKLKIRSRSLSGNIQHQLLPHVNDSHENTGHQSQTRIFKTPTNIRSRSLSEASTRTDALSFPDIQLNSSMLNISNSSKDDLSLTKQHSFCDLRTILLSDCHPSDCPQTLLDTLNETPCKDIKINEQTLLARFTVLQARYATEIRELSTFYKQQSAAIEQEKLEKVYDENTLPSYRKHLYCFYDNQLSLLISRIGESLDVLESQSNNRISFQDTNSKPQLFSQRALRTLEDYFSMNSHHPYPSNATTESLAEITELTKDQVKKWFSNKRNRLGRTGKYRTDVPKPFDKRKSQKSSGW